MSENNVITNDWTEIVITVATADGEKAENIANMTVPYGIYIEDYSNLEEEAMNIAHIDLIDEDLLKMDRTKTKIHVYVSPEENPAEAVSFIKDRFNAENISYDLGTANCRTEDWINGWKKYFKPIAVGSKLLIRPTWENEYDAKGRTVLHLEPGLAFGTGTHETTRLCLELLEKYLSQGDDVLDMGCGSGILSVAALLLGANKAVGVDIDKLAVKTAVENAKKNGVEDRFEGICGNLTEKVSGKYNIVLANIVADIVIMLSEDAPKFMNEQSVYIISGIIDTREDDVLNAIKDRFEIIERKEEKGWVAFATKLK